LAALLSPALVRAQEAPEPETAKGVPVFTDGQAQRIKEFAEPKEWIRQTLWVDTKIDTDGDGKTDRVHVSVVRQKQTDTEGLKVPVVYETSPYFAGNGGTAKEFFWNPQHELGEKPPVRKNMPAIPFHDN